MKKREWALAQCAIVYEAYDKDVHKSHPPNKEAAPPAPCNSWCIRKVVAPDGSVIEEKLYPWLDETKGKLVYVGVDADGKPVTAPHLAFNSPHYITKIESFPEYDEHGKIKNLWFNEDGEPVEEPEDLHKVPKGWRSKPVIAFDYVVGVDATTWTAEHAFRIAGNVVPGMQKTINTLGHLVNNTASMVQLFAMAAKEGGAEPQGQQRE